MIIKDVLREDVMLLDFNAISKDDALNQLVDQVVLSGVLDAQDHAAFVNVLKTREAQGSTAIGDKIAIPHGMSTLISKPVVIFARSEEGVDFESLDGNPSHFFFLIATPQGEGQEHLKILSSLAGQLMHESVIRKLETATTPQAIIAAFDDSHDVSESSQVTHTDGNYDLVAVTGCATGIAHTYMAAEKLREMAEKMGYRIKVETNGSSGVDHKLSKEDIKHAKGVIVASAIKVDMARFDGKPLIHVGVAAGIHDAEKLIKQMMTTDVPAYVSSHTSESETRDEAAGFYQHLMSGVSHMLPFVISGGILIAIAFMVDQVLGVPDANLGQLGSFHPQAAFFNSIGGMAFSFMLPVLAGYIAYSIADRPGLVAGFVAGGLASAGGSGFLGALLGGFVAGYAMNLIKKALQGLPQSLAGIKTILLFPVLGVFASGALMLLFNIPMSQLNTGLNNFLNSLSGTNAVLLGALVAGMMAIDLGGPINKAAYVFGTGTLAATVTSGGSSVMAAVMAGGMVPPLAIFIATRLFKNRFTKMEQDSGITNFILGLSFITEGAIPFASADPIPMLVSFVGGSALTGALVMGMNIKVLAPHGGIFVIMLVSKPLFYLLFILVGSVVSAFLISLLKKPIETH